MAAGWVTSISRRMALPSLVSTIPESIGETRGRSGTGQRRVLLGTGDLEKVFCLGAIGPVCPNAGGDRGADRAGRAPPEASRIILSMERGPSVVRMMSATACWDGSRRTGGRGSVAGLRSSPSGKMVLWRLAPNARGGFDRRSGWWVCDIRDETHLGGGDVVQLRFATGLTLGVGVWMGRGGAIGQSRWVGKSLLRKCFSGRRGGSRAVEYSLITMMGLCMPCILAGRSLVNSATLLGWIQAARCGGASRSGVATP